MQCVPLVSFYFLTLFSFPCWSYYSPKGTTFYGLPIHGNSGSKAGIDAVGDLVNPDTRNYTPNRKNLDKCIRMLQKHIPKVSTIRNVHYSLYALITCECGCKANFDLTIPVFAANVLQEFLELSIKLYLVTSNEERLIV